MTAGTAPCSRCGQKPVVNSRPNADIVVCEDCAFKLGRELAADFVESLRPHQDADPNSTCEDGCGFFNYAATKLREAEPCGCYTPQEHGRRGCAQTIASAEAVAAFTIEHAWPGEVLTGLGDVWAKCGCGETINVPAEDGKTITSGHVRAAYRAHLVAAAQMVYSPGQRTDGGDR